MKKSLVALALAALAAACAALPGRGGAPVTAIVGATVVDPAADAPHAASRDSTVLLEGRTIRAVGPSASTPVPPGAKVI
ncbi:MAG TPA: hypothetical protein VLS49_02135, partial [Usitatibacter sp.]|nr:hypothetical protein [Usitatibacter sp.]